jgi:Tfp pilus assembly protein PilN
MIRINLLPTKKEKTSRSLAGGAPGGDSSAKALVAAAIVLGALVVGFYGYTVFAGYAVLENQIAAKTKDKATRQKTVDGLKKQVAGLEELNSLVENQLQALNALSPADRLIWAEKLHQMAALIPANVYLTTLEMTETAKDIETAESQENTRKWKEAGSKGAPPAVVKKPKMTQTLKIEGIAYSENVSQRPQLMLDFYNALRTYSSKRPFQDKGKEARFMDGFKDTPDGFQIKSYQRDWIEEVEVTRFVFELTSLTREG